MKRSTLRGTVSGLGFVAAGAQICLTPRAPVETLGAPIPVRVECADDGAFEFQDLIEGEYTSKLVAADPEWTHALPDGAGLVVLDGTVTEELEAEGWAKDRIRELQELRKTTGLDVSDRIQVVLAVSTDKADWARTHAGLIAGEILATGFEIVEPGALPDGTDIGDGVLARLTKA